MSLKNRILDLEATIEKFKKEFDKYRINLKKSCSNCGKTDFEENMCNISTYFPYKENYICKSCVQIPKYDRRKENNDKRKENDDRRKENNNKRTIVKNNRCPKCNNSDINACWRKKGEHKEPNSNLLLPEKYYETETIFKHCRFCGYEWLELPSDYKPQ